MRARLYEDKSTDTLYIVDEGGRSAVVDPTKRGALLRDLEEASAWLEGGGSSQCSFNGTLASGKAATLVAEIDGQNIVRVNIPAMGGVAREHSGLTPRG